MKVTYTANDGTEFDSADECLAYEEKASKQCEKWQQLVTRKPGGRSSELLIFLGEVTDSSYSESTDFLFYELKDFWPYRQRFVELARTFIEADPTLKPLIDGD